MQDDFNTSAWAEHHGQVSTMFHRILHQTAAVFLRLNAYQYDAPWQREAKRRPCVSD